MRSPGGVARTLPVLVLVAACGGKRAAPSDPALAVDPCGNGVHAAGMSVKAATWDAVAVLSSPDGRVDGVCAAKPCGPDEAVSFVGEAPDELVAVKVDGGWVAFADVWDAGKAVPEHRLTRLRDLLWLQLVMEPEAGKAAGWRYLDFVIDPAQGRVLWRAVCASEGDTGHPTVVTRDGDSFGYVRCDQDVPIGFTAEQAGACPSYQEPR